MSPLISQLTRGLALLAEWIGALAVIGYVVAALVQLVRRRSLARARLLVAEGAVAGLSFKTAAALLKTIGLNSWGDILAFTAVLTLRIVLKHLFTWEEKNLHAEEAAPERGGA